MELRVKQLITYDAAGGVVLDELDRVLVLRRAHKNEVRLPKGHVEARELLEDAAAREIREESGFADLEMLTSLGVQVVEFDLVDRHQHVARQEFYFLFRLRSHHQVPRDPYELQFEPEWVAIDEAMTLLTYPAESEFVRRAQAWLHWGDKGLLEWP
jgi:8-oxo-dGTP pyrophosphatase MutT (NUDIX family)